MSAKTNQVTKMLDTEEASLLRDIVAGLNALLQSNNAVGTENAVEGTGAQEVMMEQTAAPKPEMETEEEPVVKSDDGPTANDKAEERVEDGTQITEGNMQGVAKMLASLMSTNQVQKSQQPQAQASGVDANAVAQIVVKSLEPVINRVGTVEKDLSNMLEALGFSEAMDTVEKSVNPVEQVQKSVNAQAPVVNQDSGNIIDMIGQAIYKEMAKADDVKSVDGGPKYATKNTLAHKELGSAIVAHHTSNKGVN